jgi:nitrate reductase gamma subunit
MTLLDFARGPGLYWSVLIMITGIIWRIAGVLLLPRKRNLAAPRHGVLRQAYGAAATIVMRSVPRESFWKRTAAGSMLAYTFHIGFLIILLGGAPHILLWQSAFGLGWPPLPKGIVAIASGLTLSALVIAYVRRLLHPVLRLLSNFDDYFSLILCILPILSGILLAEETIFSYGTLLIVHILSVEALMIWLPFGKLAHFGFVFLGRGAQGIKFTRKGAAT